MGAYPASVSTFTVVGRLHIDEGDGIDVGADPDVNPQEGVSVTFTPQLSPKRIRVPGFGLVDIAPVAAVTDADGYVKTIGGDDVVLAYGGDPDITPTGWTWLVSIEATSVVPEDEFSIAGSAGGTVDLSEFASVSPADPGAEVVAWVSARDAAIAAKDDAEAAKAAAEAAQAAAEAVPTSNDGIVAGLVADSGSSTRGALDAAIAQVTTAGLTTLLSLCTVTPRAATSGTWTDTLDTQAPFAGYATNGGTNGDYLAWDVALLPGTYKVSLAYRARTDGGIVSVWIGGTEITTFDTYEVSGANRHITRSDIVLTGYATRWLTLALSGKNASSSGYVAQIGGINLVRVSD